MLSAGGNVGIITGPEGKIVIDSGASAAFSKPWARSVQHL